MGIETTELNNRKTSTIHLWCANIGLRMHQSVWFVVCSCFLLSKAQTVSASCPLVMTPSSVVVQYGDAFTVECISTTDQIEGMGWESTYKGTGLIEADHVPLNIEKVDRWAIQSQCYLNLNNGTQCTKHLPITVYKMPDSVSLLHENTKQPLVEHQDYGFECAVANVAPLKNVHVTWIKNDMRIVKECLATNESNENPGNCTSGFTLSAQNTDHGGTLMCEAKFDFGPMGPNLQPVRSPVMDLQVLFQPFFEKSNVEMVEVPANGKLTLDCTAQGSPTPQYHWQLPQPIQQKVGSGPILDLKGPLPGTYNCTAANSQGSSVKRFVITDAPRDYTVLAAVIGVAAVLGVLLLISGPFIVTKDGTFSLNKGGYARGQPV